MLTAGHSQSSSSTPRSLALTSWGAVPPPVRVPNLKVRVIADQGNAAAIGPVNPPPIVSRFSTSTGPSVSSDEGAAPPKNGPHTLARSASSSSSLKKPGWMKFLTVKEPSTAAFVEYAEQQRKVGAGKPTRAAAPSPGFSKQRLPDFVPKVNSKWDGMPIVAHETARMPEWKKSSDALRRTKSAHGNAAPTSPASHSRNISRNTSAQSTTLPSRSGTARSSMDRRRGHERPNGHLNLFVPAHELPPLPDASARKVLAAQNGIQTRGGMREKDDDPMSSSQETIKEVKTPESSTPVKDKKTVESEESGDAHKKALEKGSPSKQPPPSSLDEQDGHVKSVATSPSNGLVKDDMPSASPKNVTVDIPPANVAVPKTGATPTPQMPFSAIHSSSPAKASPDFVVPNNAKRASQPALGTQEASGTAPGTQGQWPLPPHVKASARVSAPTSSGQWSIFPPQTQVSNEILPGLATPAAAGASEAPRPAVPRGANGGRSSVPVPRNFARPQPTPVSAAQVEPASPPRAPPRNFARPFAPRPHANTAPSSVTPPVVTGRALSVAGPALNRGLRPPAAAIGRPVTKDTALEPIIEVDGASMLSVTLDKDSSDEQSNGRQTPQSRLSGAGQTFWNGDDDDEDDGEDTMLYSEVDHDPVTEEGSGETVDGDEWSLAESDASAASAMSDQWFRTPKERLGLGSMIRRDRDSDAWPSDMAQAEADLLAELDKSAGMGRLSGDEQRPGRGNRGSLGSMFRRSTIRET